mmetsp:Transcript_24748/g.38533  ORF Transcript_24748/g.38533 Transcript_24748/m.38533 type:complete len:90 (+) Transcript_24748:276-545(+)
MDEIKMIIWDTCGQDRFHTLTSAYFQRTQGAVLVYDCTERDGFERISNWIGQVRNFLDPDEITMALVANKNDIDEDDHVISKEQGLAFA